MEHLRMLAADLHTTVWGWAPEVQASRPIRYCLSYIPSPTGLAEVVTAVGAKHG